MILIKNCAIIILSIILLMIVYSNYQANALKSTPLKKWEYWDIIYDVKSSDQLDRLGREGWELVIAVSEVDIQSSGCTCLSIYSNSFIRLFFKRECN